MPDEVVPEAPIPEPAPIEAPIPSPEPIPEPIQPEIPPEPPTAHIPANEPIAPTPEPLPQATTSVVVPVLNFARDLAVKARAVIQGRKRKKLDKILEAVTKHGSITNDQVEKLLHVSDATATRYLTQLEKEGKLKQEGKTGKSVKYKKNMNSKTLLLTALPLFVLHGIEEYFLKFYLVDPAFGFIGAMANMAPVNVFLIEQALLVLLLLITIYKPNKVLTLIVGFIFILEILHVIFAIASHEYAGLLTSIPLIAVGILYWESILFVRN